MASCSRYTLSVSVTCDRSVVFPGYSSFLHHDITDILQKVALPTLLITLTSFLYICFKKLVLDRNIAEILFT